MANVYDVGQYITELVPTVDKMKLYKLCYFSQGWKLAWTGCPYCRHGLTVLSLLLCAIETSQAAIPQA